MIETDEETELSPRKEVQTRHFSGDLSLASFLRRKMNMDCSVPSPLCCEKHRKVAQRKAQSPVYAVLQCTGTRLKLVSCTKGQYMRPLLYVFQNFCFRSKNMSSFPWRTLMPGGYLIATVVTGFKLDRPIDGVLATKQR